MHGKCFRFNTKCDISISAGAFCSWSMFAEKAIWFLHACSSVPLACIDCALASDVPSLDTHDAVWGWDERPASSPLLILVVLCCFTLHMTSSWKFQTFSFKTLNRTYSVIWLFGFVCLRCILLFKYMYTGENVLVRGRYPQRPKEGIRSPRAGVAGNCKPLDMGAGNWILISAPELSLSTSTACCGFSLN